MLNLRAMRERLLVLDLDETLLHSVALDEVSDKVLKKLKKKYLHFPVERYICFLRPKAVEFLQWASKQFTLAIWTAASPDYGFYILETLFRKIANVTPAIIMTSDHTTLSEDVLGNHKDLSLVWQILPQYNPGNTYMIDDHPGVKSAYPCNVYTIPVFNPIDPNVDRELAIAKGHLVRSIRKPNKGCLLK